MVVDMMKGWLNFGKEDWEVLSWICAIGAVLCIAYLVNWWLT